MTAPHHICVGGPTPDCPACRALGSPVLVEAVDDAFFTLQGGRRLSPVLTYGDFGLTWSCNDVDAALTELKAALDAAKNAGLLTTHWFTANEGDPIAVAAQATYDGVVNNNLVIMSDAACQANTAEVRAAASHLRALLADTGAKVPDPLRPDYVPQPSSNPLDQLKPLLIGGAVIAAAVVVAPLVFEFVGFSRTLRRTHGYRRRR